MTRPALTDPQLVLLSAAAQRDDLRIILPERLRGGAAQKLLSTLTFKGLIEPTHENILPLPLAAQETPGMTSYQISQLGLVSLGIGEPPQVPADEMTQSTERSAKPGSGIPRAGTKLAGVIELLERVEGASLAELTAATGWLPHTTRAALTGLRKRGLTLARSNREDGTTIYRSAPAAAEARGEGA
jgi:hypothetical protein